MEKILRILSFSLLVLSYEFCNAQWQQISNGLNGGNISCFAIKGDSIYAGTYGGGIFLSTNNGRSWTGLNTGLYYPWIVSLVISGHNIFAGTDGNGVYLSSNKGSTWAAVDSGLTSEWVNVLAKSGSNIIVGTNVGVYLSSNNGSTWVAADLTETNVSALAISGDSIFAGTYDGVFLSTNNGNNWVNIGLTNIIANTIAISGPNIFAGSYYGAGVFLSTNNGSSWAAVNTGLINTNISSLAISGNYIFAGTGGWGFEGVGVFLSTNNGVSWIAANNGLSNNAEVQALTISGPNIFAGIGDWRGGSGVYLSSNNGSSWAEVNKGLTATPVGAFAISGPNIFTGTDNGVFLSSNNGSSWVNKGLADTIVSALAISGPNIFAGSDDGVFLSSNNGSSWVNTDLPSGGYSVTAIAISGSNIFAGTGSDVGGNGVFLSSNNGSSWTAVNTGLIDTVYTKVYALTISGTNIFAGTGGEGVFLSTNNGSNWTAINNGLTGNSLYIYAVEINGSNIFIGTVGGVFLSSNNGSSWVNKGLADTIVYALAISGPNIFAGSDDGVFLSTNNGSSWSNVSEGLTCCALDVRSFAISGDTIYAGTNGAGVWKQALSEIINHNYNISGNVNYDNTKSTPMTKTKVYLANSKDTIIADTTTDATGHYLFANLINGTYKLSCSTTKTWGGVNPVDALIVNRKYIGMYSLTDSLKMLAADVNSDTKINPVDALIINRRYIGIVKKFTINDWLFNCNKSYIFPNATVNIDGSDVTKNIITICAGDVNASYVPPARVMSYELGVMSNININIDLNKPFDIPVYLNDNVELGAMGIKLRMENGELRILNVKSDIEGLIYNITENQESRTKNQEINIAWAAENEGLFVNPSQPLFYLIVMSQEPRAKSQVSLNNSFQITSESVLADIDANLISTDKLEIPEIIETQSLASVQLQIYPNPFNNITNINYTIPEDGNVEISLYNVLGEKVACLTNQKQQSGNHSIKYDGSGLSQGVYYLRCTIYDVQFNNSIYTKTNILMIAR